MCFDLCVCGILEEDFGLLVCCLGFMKSIQNIDLLYLFWWFHEKKKKDINFLCVSLCRTPKRRQRMFISCDFSVLRTPQIRNRLYMSSDVSVFKTPQRGHRMFLSCDFSVLKDSRDRAHNVTGLNKEDIGCWHVWALLNQWGQNDDILWFFCFQDSMKRKAVGIWGCTKCKKIVAGGAWVYR